MYDYPELAKQKLQGTMCYYGGRAVYVKEVMPKWDNGENKPPKSYLRLCSMDNSGKSWTVPLVDPKLQFMEYNIGYSNIKGYAIWYYRNPLRQWKQGIAKSQVGVRDLSKLVDYGMYMDFGPNEYTAAMMENIYPSFESAKNMLNTPGTIKVAFHKDFAIYRDKFTGDLVIEYKGCPSAFEDAYGNFRCTDKTAYLKESIQEMNIKVR